MVTARCVSTLRVAWLLGLLLSSVHPQSPNMSALLITDPSMSRMVALSERGGKCTYSLDRSYIRQRVLDSPCYPILEETEARMDALMKACMIGSPLQLRLLLQLIHVLVGGSCFSRSLAQQVHDRFLGDFRRALGVIYPGTLWCGPGNRANDPNDVGLFKDSDACCREHDNCPDNIPGWDSKHGLFNKGPFTKSHCDCDDRFFQCLKDVMRDTKSLVAPQIGKVFFNLVGPQCFKEEYPIVKCAERHPLFQLRCKRYELDTSRPKQWQWFDPKVF